MNEADTCRQQVVPLLQDLRYIRQFYVAFPPDRIRQTVSRIFTLDALAEPFSSPWSHQILLIGKVHPMKLGPCITLRRCGIVAEPDILQTKVDALKPLHGETGAEPGALPPAVLDRAFKGEL